MAACFYRLCILLLGRDHGPTSRQAAPALARTLLLAAAIHKIADVKLFTRFALHLSGYKTVLG